MVVELLQRPLPAGRAEAGGETARMIGRFEECHIVAGSQKIVGGRKPGNPGANDANAHPAVRGRVAWAHVAASCSASCAACPKSDQLIRERIM